MIIRHIPMKSARLSNFLSLVNYITDEQSKQERVGKIRISNCTSIDLTWATYEILAAQAKNQRAKGDKTYHILISFAPGENPSAEALKVIEDRAVSSIGFEAHQRISAVHHDTDNLHIHLAISKIHPKTSNLIEPYRAYKIFAEVASKLEIEFRLKITNHQTRKSRSENLADDMERHSGIESLINWMKRNCWVQIDSANSWMEVHNILAQHELTIRVRSNGFVFCNDKGLMVKASSVSRSFSKKNLESKLGEFKPSPPNSETAPKTSYRYEPLNKKITGTALYVRYRHEKEQGHTRFSENLKRLRTAKSRLIDKAKQRGRIKRAILRRMRMSKAQKKYLYQQINKTLMSDITQIRKKYSTEYQRSMDRHKKQTWADWLRQKAQEGDIDALKALRYQKRNNQSQYALSGVSADFHLADFRQIDSVTKEGTEIYKVGKAVIRNDGKEIKIAKGGSLAALKKALAMAQQQYGNCIRVNGSPLFKKIILHMMIHNNTPIAFADLDMEIQRKKMILEQEQYHDQSKRCRLNDGRGALGNTEVVRTILSGINGKRRISPRTKSNTFSIRSGPPAESQNSLRNLSQLDVVQLTGRGQVLLPDHAHDQLERQRLQFDNDVRWKVFGLKPKRKNPKY